MPTVKSYLSRLLGINHTVEQPSVLDCEGLSLKNMGVATATSMAVSGALTGAGSSQAVLESMTGDVTVAAGVSAIGSGKVLSAMLSNLVPKYVAVPVSSAELLAINGTPKTIVAAPGAGYITVIHRVVGVYNYVTSAYINNGILGLYETNAAGTLLTGTLTLASFLGAGADVIKEFHPTATSTTTGLTRLDNKAVVLTQATGESTGGQGDVTIHCWYSIIPHGL